MTDERNQIKNIKLKNQAKPKNIRFALDLNYLKSRFILFYI